MNIKLDQRFGTLLHNPTDTTRRTNKTERRGTKI